MDTQKQNTFTPGALVVYPAQGVGEIERIDQQEVGGSVCDFYIVRILSNNVTLMVPVYSASRVGLRYLVSLDEAKDILENLKSDTSQPIFTGQNWNRRFREYSEKLQSPDLRTVAMVLRELLLLSRTKELSFGERRLLEQSMALVVGELAEVLSCPEDTLRDDLQSSFAPLHTEEETQ